MNNQSHLRFFRILMSVLLLTAAISMPIHSALAQTGDTTGEVEIVGPVEALTATTLTVNQRTVNYAKAEVKVQLTIGLVV